MQNHTCAQVPDIFGILTNGQQWAIYRYEHGNPVVSYEFHELCISMKEERESFAGQVEKLLSALVGIMAYQVQSRLAGGVVKRARRDEQRMT